MLPALATLLGSMLLLIIIKLVLLLVAIAYYTLAERKIMAAVQRRFGPNVVGLWGLLQPLADGLKLFGKELVIPSHANSRIFMLAPLAVLTFALAAWYVIPFNMFDHSERMSIDTVVQLAAGTDRVDAYTDLSAARYVGASGWVGWASSQVCSSR
jgi:NADH:ubiquinone oxidoreductase subunit H